jgi:hypothetical protein
MSCPCSYYLVLPLSLIPEPAFRQLISLLGSWVQQLPALAAQASSGAAAGLQQHVAQQLQQLTAVLAQAVSGYWQAASPVQWLVSANPAAAFCQLLRHAAGTTMLLGFR